MQLTRSSIQATRKAHRAQSQNGWGSFALRATRRLAAVGGILLVSVSALAEEPGSVTISQTVSVAPIAGEDLLFEGIAAVETSELEAARGGERTVLNLEDMMSHVDGNSITGTVTTGAATVSGESFQDFNGVSSVIINSGNNVSINSSTTVNIVID